VELEPHLDAAISETKGGVFNICDFLERHALNCIFQFGFGVKINSFTTDRLLLQTASHQAGAIGYFVTTPPFMWPFLEKTTFYRNIMKASNEQAMKLIKNRLDERKSDADGRKSNLLDLLLEDEEKNGLDRPSMSSIIKDMIGAGTDTTALTLSHLLYLVSQDSKVEEKLVQECAQFYASTEQGKNATIDDMDKMVYTEQCIKETLRIVPSAPLLSRSNIEEDEVDGFRIPKESAVFVNYGSLAANETLWPNPSVFDPDRFAPGRKFDKFAFVPFGGGARICPGLNVAYLEMKAVLMMLLPKYRFLMRGPFILEWNLGNFNKDKSQLMSAQPRS